MRSSLPHIGVQSSVGLEPVAISNPVHSSEPIMSTGLVMYVS